MSPDSDLCTDAELEAHLRALIAFAGRNATSLVDLTLQAQGAYPTEVRRLANQVMTARPDLFPPSILGFQPIHAELFAARSALPIPHPLDFEWRYASPGWVRLTEEISQHAPNGGRDIALFGTSGFAEVLPDFMPDARVTLFERRGEACEALAERGLRVQHGDVAVTTITVDDTFDVVVADPPWYPALIELFVQAAARVLGPDGLLLLCLPGRATRPGIAGELAHLVEIAGAVGFSLEQHDEAAVVYESPPFELSALAAADLEGFDPHWRRADLLRFRKGAGSQTNPLSAQGIAAPDTTWREVSIGRARIRVDLGAPVTATSRLESIVAGDVLDSVSSRDTRRASATIWTTTNRVFRTDAPVDLMAALRSAAAGETIDRAWSDPVARLVDGELERLRQLGIE